MKGQFDDGFGATASPLTNSHEKTPEKHYYSSSSETVSSLLSPTSSLGSPSSSKTTDPDAGHVDSKKGGVKNMGNKSRNYAYRIRDHVKLGPKLSETVKSKLRLGARIIQEGGRENIFKQIFGVMEGEELLKASLCYLSTTAGPIAGLLFISTEKIAFWSERSVAFHCPQGQLRRIPYKVMIPIMKIKRASQSENVDKPEQKYIQIVTEDNFEFWFMGFLRYEKAFMNLEKAISATGK